MALYFRSCLSIRPLDDADVKAGGSRLLARDWRARGICRLFLAACLFLFFSPFCQAQDFPRWELFGGAQYYLVGRPPTRSITTQGHGPQAGLARSFNNYFRVAGEFDAGFSDRIMDLETLPASSRHHNSKLLLGLVGPEFVYRRPNRKLSVFGHYLTGIAYARDNQLPIEPPVTGVSWINALGSGVDLKIPHQVSIRVLEVDWMRTNFPNNPHSNWRFASGFVLRLGRQQH